MIYSELRELKDHSIYGELELPADLIALIPKIELFNSTNKNNNKTEWFAICSNSKAFLAWRKRELIIGDYINNLALSLIASRAYSEFFEFSKHNKKHCSLSEIEDISDIATRLIDSLPHGSLLPKAAKEPAFLNGLQDLSQWNYKDLPYEISARGNFQIRWLIKQITEEFCYSFSKPPSIPIIGDLIRIGWHDIGSSRFRGVATRYSVSRVVGEICVFSVFNNTGYRFGVQGMTWTAQNVQNLFWTPKQQISPTTRIK